MQVGRSQWIHTIYKVAEAVADLGITVTFPKVVLDAEEPFECAGVVANNFFVFPNGRVYRCPLCEDFPLNSKSIENTSLINTPRINEQDLFELNIPEGCVMNRLIQPDNLRYKKGGEPEYKIACCLLKEEISGK